MWAAENQAAPEWHLGRVRDLLFGDDVASELAPDGRERDGQDPVQASVADQAEQQMFCLD
jgi:hypothetical protein